MTYNPPNPNGIALAGSATPMAMTANPSAVSNSATTPAVNYEFLTGTSNGWFDALGYSWASYTIVPNGSVTGGAITFECTDDTTTASSGAGMYVQLTSGSATSSGDRFSTLTFSGSAQTINMSRQIDAPITTRYVRIRVSTAVTGGSIGVYATFKQIGPPVHAQSVSLGTSQIPAGNNTIGVASLNAGTNTFGAITTASGIVTDKTSSAVTTTGSSTVTIVNGTTSGSTFAASFCISVTAVSGTNPTLDVRILESHDGGSFQYLYDFERITSSGSFVSPPIRISGAYLRYIYYTGGTSPSFTFSIQRLPKLSSGVNLRHYYDRNMTYALNSTTSTYYTWGSSSLSYTVNYNLTTGSSSVLTIQGSIDGTYWYDSIGVSSSSTTGTSLVASGNLTNHYYKWTRVSVTSAGNASMVINYVCISALGAF